LEFREDARLVVEGKAEPDGFRQLVLDEAEDAETEVANVDTERMLWLLYRVNVLVEVFVLAMEFRQLLDAEELEMLEPARPLRMLVGDAARRGCGCGSPFARAGVSITEGGGGDIGTEGEFNPIIRFDTCIVRVEPRFEIGCELCESDRVLMAASPPLFPNDSFHLLGFFVTVGIDTGAGTGGGGGTSGNDWRAAEADRVWRLSSRASV